MASPHLDVWMEQVDETISLDSSIDQQCSVWDDEGIHPATAKMLAVLPLAAYPYATARDFPHVLNVLAKHWDSPQKFVEAAETFLRSAPWPRTGFPRPVFFEILVVVACHGSLAKLGVVDLRSSNVRPADYAKFAERGGPGI